MAIPTDAVALNNQTVLARNTNQALGIGHFAIDFMSGKIGNPDASVLERTTMFHTDSVLCGISAIALNTNAPIILRKEAAEYPNAKGATVFGSTVKVAAEKAIVANSNAVREWDSNGTNFGYNPTLGHTAGEFGHNDFYPVAIAAAQQQGATALTRCAAWFVLTRFAAASPKSSRSRPTRSTMLCTARLPAPRPTAR